MDGNGHAGGNGHNGHDPATPAPQQPDADALIRKDSVFSNPKDEYILSPEPIGLRRLADKWGASEHTITRLSAEENWPKLREDTQARIENRRVNRLVTLYAREQAAAETRRLRLARFMQARGAEEMNEKKQDGSFKLRARSLEGAAAVLAKGLEAERAERGTAYALFQRLLEQLAEVVNESFQCPECRARFFEGYARLKRASADEEASKQNEQSTSGAPGPADLP